MPTAATHLTMGTEQLARLRLMQLVSPALPTGAFSYSQGLEWAVEAGWVYDTQSLADWLNGLLTHGLARLELPMLKRLYDACMAVDEQALRRWSELLYAHRETRELREEERNRARALTSLLIDLDVAHAKQWQTTLRICHPAPFALAASNWRVSLEDCALGYGWGWLENQVASAVKLIPLGQTAGQRVQLDLAVELPAVVAIALALSDEEIGATAPAQVIASSRHETQYTRLFRS